MRLARPTGVTPVRTRTNSGTRPLEPRRLGVGLTQRPQGRGADAETATGDRGHTPGSSRAEAEVIQIPDQMPNKLTFDVDQDPGGRSAGPFK